MRIFVFFFFTLLVSGLYGQKTQGNLDQGDQVFSEGDYYSASLYYLQALRADTTRLRTAEKYAESCRLFYNYEEAEKWYAYILRNDSKEKFPEVRFWLGMMQKSLGKYEEAGKNFAAYAAPGSGKNPGFLKRALAEVENCQWAKGKLRDSLPVSIRHLDRNINTPYSDFGGIQWGDSLLLFSSLRFQSDLEYESLPEGIYLTNIYQSRITPAGPAKSEALSNKINLPGMHNANICFTADKKTFFFTRCPEERRPDLKCQLFMVKLRNGKWQKPIPLDTRFNMAGYTSTQPAIANTSKEEVLYFVSDRPGGMGGNDIWYSIIKKTRLTDPVNLGSLVNTPGNEITPFWNDKENLLYFSSDYHKGFGGYDIFRTNGAYNQWSVAENIGYPLNTGFNDLYFTTNTNDSSGYLTSNRPGSYFIKSQTCCNDLYRWELVKPIETRLIAKTDTLPLPEEVHKLLPLSLYFHNDVPGPALPDTKALINPKDKYSRSAAAMRTHMNYKTTVADYYVMKEKYIQAYTKGLPKEEKEVAATEMNRFFEDYVLQGLSRLEKVAAHLIEDMRKGKQVRITVKGYTSPLNTAEYNKNLAKRRISSLVNYFREYEDGIFVPYLEKSAKNGGRFELFEEPIGEEQASKLVSDNPSDLRNSVYSRAAALERRIQILYYDAQDTIQEPGSTTLEPGRPAKSSAKSQETTKPQLPANVRFTQQFHDFGEIRDGGVGIHDFEFENLGPVPFRIIALEISCGCTVADWPKNEIPMGGKGLIRVTFSAHNVKGEQNENVVVKGNVAGGEKALFIKAFVK